MFYWHDTYGKNRCGNICNNMLNILKFIFPEEHSFLLTFILVILIETSARLLGIRTKEFVEILFSWGIYRILGFYKGEPCRSVQAFFCLLKNVGVGRRRKVRIRETAPQTALQGQTCEPIIENNPRVEALTPLPGKKE